MTFWLAISLLALSGVKAVDPVVPDSFSSFMEESLQPFLDGSTDMFCYLLPLEPNCGTAKAIKLVTGTDPGATPEAVKTWVNTEGNLSVETCNKLADLEEPYLDMMIGELLGTADFHLDTATGLQKVMKYAFKYFLIGYTVNDIRNTDLYGEKPFLLFFKDQDMSKISCKYKSGIKKFYFVRADGKEWERDVDLGEDTDECQDAADYPEVVNFCQLLCSWAPIVKT